MRMADFWDSHFALRAIRRVFIFWKPSPPAFLNVNFNGSIMDSVGEASFAIKDSLSRLVATGGRQLFSPSISESELRASWADIVYTRCTLHADQLMIEGNSFIIIG